MKEGQYIKESLYILEEMFCYMYYFCKVSSKLLFLLVVFFLPLPEDVTINFRLELKGRGGVYIQLNPPV